MIVASIPSSSLSSQSPLSTSSFSSFNTISLTKSLSCDFSATAELITTIALLFAEDVVLPLLLCVVNALVSLEEDLSFSKLNSTGGDAALPRLTFLGLDRLDFFLVVGGGFLFGFLEADRNFRGGGGLISFSCEGGKTIRRTVSGALLGPLMGGLVAVVAGSFSFSFSASFSASFSVGSSSFAGSVCAIASTPVASMGGRLMGH